MSSRPYNVLFQDLYLILPIILLFGGDVIRPSFLFLAIEFASFEMRVIHGRPWYAQGGPEFEVCCL